MSITTAEDGVAASADPIPLAPGRYAIAEDPPETTAAGRWSLSGVGCNGVEQPVGDAATADVALGASPACVFTNIFTPSGSIVVRKRTEGGTGRVGFVIRPLTRSAPATYEQTTTTTRPGVPMRATGDDTSSLPLGSYDIVEIDPTTPGGAWTLESVICDGKPLGAAQGRARVTLTSAHPAIDCTFIDRFERGSEPANEQPNGQGPEGDVLGASAASRPAADLRITKSVSPRVARPGQRIVYRIVVTNRGPDTAHDIVGTRDRADGPQGRQHPRHPRQLPRRPARPLPPRGAGARPSRGADRGDDGAPHAGPGSESRGGRDVDQRDETGQQPSAGHGRGAARAGAAGGDGVSAET